MQIISTTLIMPLYETLWKTNDDVKILQSNHKSIHKSQSNIIHHIISPKALTTDPATGFYNPFPSFPFSGSLRPVYPLSEHRTLPKSIPHPVWWQDGNPKYSRSLATRNKIEILDAKAQDAMRKSCRLAREVLDIAAAAAKPGITTDKIDEIVHQACIERNVSLLLLCAGHLICHRMLLIAGEITLTYGIAIVVPIPTEL